MTRFLTHSEILRAHRRVVELSGGSEGLRDPGGLEASLAQPQMTFGGVELYASLTEKAAALGFSLINNHPFIDGNKRIAHAANGRELDAPVDEQERVILALAAAEMGRDELVSWLEERASAGG
jgi:death on curing protein